MESKTGSLLSLIGGILCLVLSILLLGAALTAALLAALKNVASGVVFGIIFLSIGILYIIYGTFAVKASEWMKNEDEIKKGGIVAVIVGILGLNLLVVIGGVLGLVDSRKIA